MQTDIVHFPKPANWPPDECAVSLDAQGNILSTSSSWVAAALHRGGSVADCGLGRNYLEFCTGDDADEVRGRLADLLAGRIDHFVAVYDCGCSGRGVPVALLATRQGGAGPTRFILRHISMRTNLYADDGSLRETLGRGEPAELPLPPDGSARAGQGALPALLAAVDDLRLALDELSRSGADFTAISSLTALLRGTVLLIDEIARGRGAFGREGL
jgi:hypothetical protein